MIHSFILDSTPVHVYNSPLMYITPGVLTYSFATDHKSCLDVSCSKCSIYTDGDCTTKLRKAILNQPNFTSKFPELLL